MSRLGLIALGVLFLISGGIGASQNPPKFGSSAEAIGYLVGLYGIPFGLILMGIFKKDRPKTNDPTGAQPGLGATDVPRSWSQLSPITKVAVGCLGLVVCWICVILVIALAAKLSGSL